MPELPEVEIMCRNLTHWTQNKKFIAIDGVPNSDRILQTPIEKCYRRGKFCILPIGTYFLVIHFRMTGKIVMLDAPRKFVRMTFVLDDGQKIALVDQRRFATVDILTAQEYQQKLSLLGEEVWPSTHPADWFAQRLGAFQTSLKSLLLRQDIVAGIGNIMASEICFRMGCTPHKPAKDVTKEQWAKMNDAIHEFVDAVLEEESGEEVYFVSQGGGLPKSFLVYGRTGEPCTECATPIVQWKKEGRSTFVCTSCQD